MRYKSKMVQAYLKLEFRKSLCRLLAEEGGIPAYYWRDFKRGFKKGFLEARQKRKEMKQKDETKKEK